MIRIGLVISVCLLASFHLLAATVPLNGDEEDYSIDQIEFFESRIRPLLANHCVECHGADTSEGGLRLDSRDAILKKGSRPTPAATAGKPDSSPLIRAVRHNSDIEMPPNKKLSERDIADLTSWVEIGLPWPESKTAISKATMPERIRQHKQNHWAFQPVRKPAIPVSRIPTGSQLDYFVRTKVNANNLTPSPRAERQILIRRATFDLTGLPPTFEQVEAFVNDDDPDAYANLIDRLLSSPHYGERWARHWLDVARYADTSGYTFDNGDRRYPFAFTYRDYVIEAFNHDLPYDQFIREQLAADHLDVPANNKTLAALGFLTVGRKYIDQHDTTDDQVDVVTRGLMGLTVSCARCHDHKYDAIPTKDYYSLFGVFANNHVPDELPLIGEPAEQVEFAAYFEKLEQLKNEVEAFGAAKHRDLLVHIREHFADYLARIVAPNQEQLVAKQPFVTLKESELRQVVLDKWRQYLAKQSATSATLIKPTLELIALPEESFENSARKLIQHWSAQPDEFEINPLLLAKLQSQPLIAKIELTRIMDELFEETLDSWERAGSKHPMFEQFEGHQRDIAVLFFGPDSPASLSRKKTEKYLNQGEKNQLRKLRTAVNKHNSEAPEGLARAMVLRDNEPLHDQNVMIRGKGDEGEVAPRRFVAILSESEQRPGFEHASGRLDLANRIASPENPLTARVLVNRVWMHHFSQPLVDTPSDFGIRCEEPVQLDLLDFLAADFMEHNWSIKYLHRQIMLSDTYCQSSNDRPNCSAFDPENRLYWKMNRRRLEFEPLRDSILSVSGSLDPNLFGKSVDLFQRPFVNRRTIYGFIDRQDLPGLLRVFDLANPDQSAAQRIRTSVPQQSLFMMNSSFVIGQAKQLVSSIAEFDNLESTARVEKLYRRILQRDPDESELEIGLEFVAGAASTPGKNQLGPWQRYAQLLMFTNEFEFVD